MPRPRRARATTIALGSTTAGTVRLYDAAHHNVVTRSVFWPTAIWSANWNPTCTKFGASAARARIRVAADAGLIAVRAYLNNVAFVFLKKEKLQAVPRKSHFYEICRRIRLPATGYSEPHGGILGCRGHGCAPRLSPTRRRISIRQPRSRLHGDYLAVHRDPGLEQVCGAAGVRLQDRG